MYVYRYCKNLDSVTKLEIVTAGKSREEAGKKLGALYDEFNRYGMETKDNYCLDAALSDKASIFYRIAGNNSELKKLDDKISLEDFFKSILINSK